MSIEHEQAFSCIIKHNYNEAYNRFLELYSSEQSNISYMNGCIVSLILLENIEALEVFLNTESVSHVCRDFFLMLREQIHRYSTSTGSAHNKSSVFRLLVLCIESMRHSGLDDHTDIYIRTAQLLKPEDPSIYRYLAEMAFKNGSPEKGCSFLVKASKSRTK